MTQPPWDRVRRLVDEALDLEPTARGQFLDKECGEDTTLRREVEDLLHHADAAPSNFITPTNWSPPELPSGLQLGDFSILEELGRGAMGVVYRARQASLGRDVAVKVLVEGLGTRAAEVERFHREAQSVARLNHPNLVSVYADGRSEGVHWFAMEHVPGHSLRHELDLQREPQTPVAKPFLPTPDQPRHVQRVAACVRDCARALAHAHQRGVVHRDIKPSNLLLSADGTIKVADFGIARDESLGTLTQSQQVIGSLPYMSPEQARILDTDVDHRTDVYSLGVVLYEMLTLERPFGGSTSHEIYQNIRTTDAPPIAQRNKRVPRDLIVVCAMAMGRTPADRYGSAAEFADDLDRFLALEAVHATTPSLWQRGRRWAHRRRHGLAAGAVLATGLAVGLFFADRAARAETLRTTLAPIVALGDLPDWSDVPVADLAAHRATAQGLLAREDLTEADRLRVGAVAQRFEELRADRRKEGEGLVSNGLRAVGMGPEQGEAFTQGLSETIRGFRQLVHYGVVFAEEPIQLNDELFSPRLDVSVDPSLGGATVGYRVLDPRTGSAGPVEPLGTTPLRDALLPVGYLRVVVRLGGGRLREFSRVIEVARTYQLDIAPIAEAGPGERTRGMQRIEGGVLAIPSNESILNPLAGQTVVVRPFMMDECEVSNLEYREFLDANPTLPRPKHWDQLTDEDDDLPVVFVPWPLARAYAEWRGKRLPSHAEWTLAARGPDLWRVPWAPPNEPLRYRGVTAQPRWPGSGYKTWIPEYLARVTPVRSAEDARTRHGTHELLHMLGNVQEWVETHTTNLSGGVTPRYSTRFTCGGFWVVGHPDATAQDLTAPVYRGVDASMADHRTGFRCALSIDG